MTIINISKRNKVIVTIIGALLVILGYYLSIYKSFGYQSNNEVIGNVLIIFSIAIIQMMWLKKDKFTNKLQTGLLVSIGIVTVIGTTFLKANYLSSELSRKGIPTNATVAGFEVDNGRRSTRNYAQLKYHYNNQQFLQRIEYFDDEYRLNQKLSILISSEDPNMFKIIKK